MSKKQQNIIEQLIDKNFLDSYLKVIQSNKSTSIKYLQGSLKSLLVNNLFKSINSTFIIICDSEKSADDYYHDLSGILDPSLIAVLIENKRNTKLDILDTENQLSWLTEGLTTILNNEKSIIITTPELFSEQIPKPENITSHQVILNVGIEIEFETFIQTFLLNGFDKKEFVSSPGDLAVRGGILDIFPIGRNNPIRIEFYGNEIDSIRDFEPISQRSIQTFKEISIIGKIYHSDDKESYMGSMLDYLSPDTIFVKDYLTSQEAIDPIEEILEKFKVVAFNQLGASDIVVISHQQPVVNQSIKSLILELRKLRYYKHKIAISAESFIHLERIKDLITNSFSEDNIENESDDLSPFKDTVDSIIWMENPLSNGFISETLYLAMFTEHEVFGRLRFQDNRKSGKHSSGLSLKQLKDLNIGDYVVHTDKGIGRFDGIETVLLGGTNQDCVRIVFADGDLLYVHLNYIHKLQKYTAEEGVLPKLSKLGSGEWNRKKDRTKKKLKDIARDLIKIYAQRKSQPGFAFPFDTIWQKEFEASFMYDDTIDQAKTTQEVKKDMESDTPMDRLVCGDVGFGKTEIAIRAAFKAAQIGKQVAVLVPTTILAQQHYMTFKDRLHNYPIIADVISRFRTSAEQKEIVSKTKLGKVDILIGTHRLLSKDINFNDLGLLVIDEEHRFGVGAKEKLRELRANIDTLTLTATPIPRTLNFSLMGARDLSVIETPPRNRLPIITEILMWDGEFLQRSINYEIDRGGQVFFVSDRVDDLEKIKDDLKMLLPHLRFGLAHGQMNSTELEKTMEKFIEGKFDVLVTTKIVESGLDIPNANTIFINRSHKFGLAELYQLKGRVGRSNTQAYCYLLIPPSKSLSSISLKRLQAIEEFSDLGSGFQLAMRDLEIRGAGNLLGPEQSGYINEIGFELYHKLLDEAVAELRYNEFAELFKNQITKDTSYLNNDEIQIELEHDALLPGTYIESDKERFYYYKRLFEVKENADLLTLIEEIRDKFGKAPKEAMELFFAVKLRISSLGTGFMKIEIKHRKLRAEFPDQANTKFYETAFPFIIDYINTLNESKLIQENKKLIMEIPLQSKSEAIEIMWRIKKSIELI